MFKIIRQCRNQETSTALCLKAYIHYSVYCGIHTCQYTSAHSTLSNAHLTNTTSLYSIVKYVKYTYTIIGVCTIDECTIVQCAIVQCNCCPVLYCAIRYCETYYKLFNCQGHGCQIYGIIV